MQETMLCRVCRQRMPISEFYKNHCYSGGYNTRCKTCELEYDRKRMAKCNIVTSGNKKCSFCLETKDVSNFSKRLRSKDGLRNRCKQCDRSEEKKYRQRNTAKQRLTKIRQMYGLEPEQYEALIKKQDGKCAICHCIVTLVVDHCHKSGKVRGLLCRKCNTGLGMFEDNIKIINSSIKYLKEYS